MKKEEYSKPFLTNTYTILYPALFNAREHDSRRSYQATFIFDKKEHLQPFLEEASKLVKNRWEAKPHDLKVPWGKCEDIVSKKTGDKLIDKLPELEGKFYVKCKLNELKHDGTPNRIAVVDHTHEYIPLERSDEIYGGALCRSMVSIGTYEIGGAGLKVYLKTVKKVGDGERLGSSEDDPLALFLREEKESGSDTTFVEPAVSEDFEL